MKINFFFTINRLLQHKINLIGIQHIAYIIIYSTYTYINKTKKNKITLHHELFSLICDDWRVYIILKKQ